MPPPSARGRPDPSEAAPRADAGGGARSAPPLKRALERRAPAHELREHAERAGMRSLLLGGIEKMREGETDLTQVLAVCGRDA